MSKHYHQPHHELSGHHHKTSDHIGHESEHAQAHKRLAHEAAHELSSPPAGHPAAHDKHAHEKPLHDKAAHTADSAEKIKHDKSAHDVSSKEKTEHDKLAHSAGAPDKGTHDKLNHAVADTTGTKHAPDKASQFPLKLSADTSTDAANLHKVEITGPGHAIGAPVADASTKEPVKHSLDSGKSLSELAATGAIIDKAPHTTDKVDTVPAGDKTPPKITVAMQDLTKPDDAQFVIKQNGQIEMHGDPDKLHLKNISVALERQAGQLNPTEAQTKAANDLTTYLAEREKAKFPDASKAGVVLDDQADVVSPQVQRRQHLSAPHSLDHMTPETQRSVQDTHRFNGSNGVDMPHASTDRMGSFGTRSVPRMRGESERQMGIKEAIAGLWKPDHDHPYETIRKHPDGGYRVGRYGFSGRQLNGLLESLGNPPDPALLEKLEEEGKLPKDFAEQLKDPKYLSQLKDFAGKLDKGIEPSKEELKALLPHKTQEALASMEVDQLKQKVGDNPGAITAGALTGKTAAQVSAEDLSSASGQQLASAGQRMFDVATSRQVSERQVAGTIPKSERSALISEALEKADMPVTNQNISAVNLMIVGESSWNPNNVNHWDSNARRGTPSKGLMQTIEPTFAAYSLPGHKNILDPLDNIIAGVRYAKHRYGSLQNVPGVRQVAYGGGYVGY